MARESDLAVWAEFGEPGKHGHEGFDAFGTSRLLPFLLLRGRLARRRHMLRGAEADLCDRQALGLHHLQTDLLLFKKMWLSAHAVGVFEIDPV